MKPDIIVSMHTMLSWNRHFFTIVALRNWDRLFLINLIAFNVRCCVMFLAWNSSIKSRMRTFIIDAVGTHVAIVHNFSIHDDLNALSPARKALAYYFVGDMPWRQATVYYTVASRQYGGYDYELVLHCIERRTDLCMLCYFICMYL